MTVYQMINLVGMASSATNNAARPEYTIPYEKFFSLLLFISVFILVVGIVLLIVRHFLRFLEQQREEEALASGFERQMLREFGGGSGPTAEPRLHTALGATAQQGPADDHSPPVPQASSGSEKADMDRAVTELIRKLQAGGLYTGTEGTISLGQGGAQAQIIRLQKNKIALIVPSYQSEEFLAQYAKRFDFLFVLLSENQVLVIQRYQDFVADRMSFD